MFSIVATMMTGISLGYLFRHKSILQNTEKTISMTIFLLLFIMGVTIGSNKELIGNLGNFGWQAAVISVSATCGSVLAAWMVMRFFFRTETQETTEKADSIKSENTKTFEATKTSISETAKKEVEL